MQKFFQYILSPKYLSSGEGIPKSNLFPFIERAVNKFNNILELENYQLRWVNSKLVLIEIDEDLEEIGMGGFAEVFKSKTTGFAIKKLKRNLLFEKGMRHRFKREYEITKELNDIVGVIPVYSYREDEKCYCVAILWRR